MNISSVPFACYKNFIYRTVLWMQKQKKNPPKTNQNKRADGSIMSAEHLPELCRPLPAMVTFQ